MAVNKAGPGGTRKRVVTLTLKGKRVADISRALGISRTAVYYHQAEARRVGELDQKEGAA